MSQLIHIKMTVQTMYKSDLLRAGKIYAVPIDTAEEWIISGLAERVASPEA